VAVPWGLRRLGAACSLPLAAPGRDAAPNTPLPPPGPVSALLEHLRTRLPDPSAQPANGPDPPPAAAAMRPSRTSSSDIGAHAGGAGGGGAAAGGELLLHGRGLAALPPELSDPAAAATLTRADLGSNPGLGAALRAAGGLPPMERLRALGLAGCGVEAWPLPYASGSGAAPMPVLQSIDLRSERGRSCRVEGGRAGRGVQHARAHHPPACVPAKLPLASTRPPCLSPPTPPPHADNPLAPLPAGGLRACPGLRVLDLSGAPPAAVASMPPPFLAAAPRLETLLLTGCRLAEAPWEALRGAAGSLRVLNLAGNSLAALPALISEFKRCAPGARAGGRGALGRAPLATRQAGLLARAGPVLNFLPSPPQPNPTHIQPPPHPTPPPKAGGARPDKQCAVPASARARPAWPRPRRRAARAHGAGQLPAGHPAAAAGRRLGRAARVPCVAAAAGVNRRRAFDRV
jgi:hypothetical protein